ncbi:MAG: ABC-F family ATP-binding cassette domain-containing protein [Pseudolysinimonas sp.]|uniref:ABC-F family ATP-binding cassette domain-containing protein n=1 Tax=Pseudolysinimonas sp. TaxID=2680009 RepID=UPI003C769848
MVHLLGAESVGLEYPTRVVFDAVTVGIDEGDRVGVVGRNGDGKSTLLKILAGRIEPDSGKVTRRGGVTLGMLDQGDTLPVDDLVSDTVVGGRAEHEWAGDARVRDVIAGLLGDVPWEGRIGDLSGGQQRRVALAALLTRDWDVVFLDEPTNHLDVEGVAWLAEHLRGRWAANRGGLVVVTHDRWFLDAVCTTTWEVHSALLEPFEGGYAAYVLQRVERDRMSATIEAKRQNLMRKEPAWLRRGPPARTSKPKFRIDAANQLIEDVPDPRDTVQLKQLATARLGKDVVDLEGVSVAYDERVILNDVTWRIAPGERTGVIGINGAGKSTLLGLVAGTVQPNNGRVKRGKTVKIAVLDQRLVGLETFMNDRVSAVVAQQKSSYVSGGVEMTPGQLLERLGFTTAQLSTPVKDLSGGQKRRLQLLLILLDEPNVLILDEPTNDLDTDMLAAMEDLLDTWPGTLLVVSHDRYLLERVTDNQYAVIDGAFRHLPGGVDQYLQLRKTRSSSSPRSGRVETLGDLDTPPSAATRSPKLAGADRRAVEKELAAVERRLEKATSGIRTAKEQLDAVDPSDYVTLGAKQSAIATLEAEAHALEEQWLALGAQLES